MPTPGTQRRFACLIDPFSFASRLSDTDCNPGQKQDKGNCVDQVSDFGLRNENKYAMIGTKEVFLQIMIPFHRVGLGDKADYESILHTAPERGCEYSFANKAPVIASN